MSTCNGITKAYKTRHQTLAKRNALKKKHALLQKLHKIVCNSFPLQTLVFIMVFQRKSLSALFA